MQCFHTRQMHNVQKVSYLTRIHKRLPGPYDVDLYFFPYFILQLPGSRARFLVFQFDHSVWRMSTRATAEWWQ